MAHSDKKKVKGVEQRHSKRVTEPAFSTDGKRILFDFGSVDADGLFRFHPSREDFDAAAILTAVLEFSKQTWAELRKATHNDGKSKHHFLDAGSLSAEAKSRIKVLHLEEVTDAVFSLRLNGKTRLIGIRDGEKFIVKWYDPQHQFSHSDR